jgi:hypothetical protein
MADGPHPGLPEMPRSQRSSPDESFEDECPRRGRKPQQGTLRPGQERPNATAGRERLHLSV